MRNVLLSKHTASDVEARISKILKGLGNPEPPLRLEDARELLRLDKGYYSSRDDSFLREAVSKLTIAGIQVLQRPTLLLEVVRKLDLRALYLPDRKRILLDQSQPEIKQRWNEAHEIGHSILPWHAELMLGDHEQSLSTACHAQIEAEANYAAGQLLFLERKFAAMANDSAPGLKAVRTLKEAFGNSFATTLWRYVECAHLHVPMVGLIGPHPRRLPEGFDLRAPFRHIIQSPAFVAEFGDANDAELFRALAGYCSENKGGPLGAGEAILTDRNKSSHLFKLETFGNSYDCLTLAVYDRKAHRGLGF